MGSGEGPGRHAGPQRKKRERFFLKNSDAHRTREVSSQEGKCRVNQAAVINGPGGWAGEAEPAKASNFRGQVSCGAQLPLA